MENAICTHGRLRLNPDNPLHSPSPGHRSPGRSSLDVLLRGERVAWGLGFGNPDDFLFLDHTPPFFFWSRLIPNALCSSALSALQTTCGEFCQLPARTRMYFLPAKEKRLNPPKSPNFGDRRDPRAGRGLVPAAAHLYGSCLRRAGGLPLLPGPPLQRLMQTATN